MNKLFINKMDKSYLASLLIFSSMLAAITYFGVMEYHGKNSFWQTDIEPTPVETRTVNTPTYKPTRTPTPIIADTSTYNESVKEEDPIIDCLFEHLPTKSMRLSQCKASIECQIGNNWYLYFSNEECNTDRQKNYDSSSPSNVYVPPTYRSPEEILGDYNADKQRIYDDLNRKINEVNNRQYESSFKPPTYVAPTSIQINVPTPTCIPLPGGDYTICDGNKLVQ